MGYYINSLCLFDDISSDIKVLIPEMNMRRRMSRFVKMGVATGLEALKNYNESVDAIITATSLGCITDSEKFLETLISREEQTLNPTPFIQSTFNTIGAQIALLSGNKSYNMTYSHRQNSFESAVLDAVLQLDLGLADSVLLGFIDEVTPTQTQIFESLNIDNTDFEVSLFFVLSKEKNPTSIATLDLVSVELEEDAKAADNTKLAYNANSLLNTFASVVNTIKGKGSVLIINKAAEEEYFRLKISKL